MTNRYYRYPNYELWNDGPWGTRQDSPLYPLVQWLGEKDSTGFWEYTKPVDGLRGDDCKTLDCYTRKTNSVAAPDVTEYWHRQGIFYSCRSMGGIRWCVCGPETALGDQVNKLKTLVVYHKENYSDPYWLMRMLADYDAYLRMIAASKDTLLLFFAVEGPDTGGYFVEILQEASVRYPIDRDRLYLDCSLFRELGVKIAEVPGYTYRDGDGAAVEDPDACLISFGALEIPALDISNRWPSLYCLNRKQVLQDDFSSTQYDRQRFLHSMTGERMMQGIAMDHDYDFCDDPAFAEYWDRMGVQLLLHETAGNRWLTFTPKSALEEGAEKLPLMIVMQEVGSANEHLAVTSINYCYEAVKLAAAGEFIALFFVLEDPASNELLTDILEEAAAKIPVDRSRMYIMGHSHNGMYAFEFARHHPTLLAGLATLGNAPWLAETSAVPGTETDEKKILATADEDIPLINMTGMCEMGLYYPVAGEHTGRRVGGRGAGNNPADGVEERIRGWQRRLRAMNCPMRSREEIIASLSSPDTATRRIGVPADRTDILYLDGVHHYIADIKNREGKFHFRLVGIENVPHLPTPSMIDLAWSFLKRFARDEKTGKILELY